MKLDFSTLTRHASVPSTQKLRGQAGTMGTSISTGPSAMTTSGDALGASGDKSVGDVMGAACPQSSPCCPPLQAASKPNSHAVSPTSPGVPAFGASSESDDTFDHEAFEERAAIMEFDGGMSRAQAEAAASTIINAMRACVHTGTTRT